MPAWEDERNEIVWEYEEPHLEVWVTDNPVIAELWHPDGELLLAITEREPIGFRLRE
jgi:hypothetical protein